MICEPNAKRAYPYQWAMPVVAEVLPVDGLQTQNTDIDLRHDELAWTPRSLA